MDRLETKRERERERGGEQRKRKTGKTQIWFGIVEPLRS